MDIMNSPVENSVENHDRFTGFEYLLIDIATQWGLDKESFPVRLEWAYEHFDQFEELMLERGYWKEQPLMTTGVIALRKAQRGEATGHMIGMDAVNSGMQVLSAITGCASGAKATGMVDPTVRADAYSLCTEIMSKSLGTTQNVARRDIKQACMTMLYGSKAVPEKLFGEGTPELAAFYAAMNTMAPGACKALSWLTHAWQPMALEHKWTLPDGHTAQVPVMQTVDCQIEVDEMNHAKFSVRYQENEGTEKGISLIANVTHSLDAYVLRSLIRRCNYDPARIIAARYFIESLLLQKHLSELPAGKDTIRNIDLSKHISYSRSGIVDLTDIEVLHENPGAAYYQLDEDYLHKMLQILNDMLAYPPFPVVCIHDESTLGSAH